MNKIPIDIDITELTGEVVQYISFGLNFILLSLTKSLIQFSGSFSLQCGNKKYIKNEVYPVHSDYGLLQLLEKKIIDITTNNERTSLNIIFEGDLVLHLISQEMYESFEILISGKRVIV